MSEKNLLEEAIREWRCEQRPEERLSGTARQRILATAREAGEQRRPSFASLFLPSRLAWTAVVPVLALTLALGLQFVSRPEVQEAGTHVAVMKDGDDVVFVIANGRRLHRVYRTEGQAGPSPQGEPFAVTDGIFRDRLDSDANLVFYRID